MNTTVWILVLFGYSATITTGPEFSSKEKCEKAAAAITQTVNDYLAWGSARKTWCVKIDK